MTTWQHWARAAALLDKVLSLPHFRSLLQHRPFPSAQTLSLFYQADTFGHLGLGLNGADQREVGTVIWSELAGGTPNL